MKTLSLGKWHRLRRCSSRSGAMTILAVDQRNSLRKLLQERSEAPFNDDQLISFKKDLVETLGSAVSAILVDPQYAAGPLIASGCLPGNAGLIVALEASGYSGSKEDRSSQVLAGWSAAKAVRLGMDAVRLLVYYHPEADSAPAIESLIDSVAQECQSLDVPLFLTCLVYPVVNGQPLSPSMKQEMILETARILTGIQGVDIYMSEFPGEMGEKMDRPGGEAACASLTRASRVPWLLISTSQDFKNFQRMAEIACRQGAAGVSAGRAAWQEAIGLKGERLRTFLNGTGLSRMTQLTSLCDETASPWASCCNPPELSPDWYEKYPGINNG